MMIALESVFLFFTFYSVMLYTVRAMRFPNINQDRIKFGFFYGSLSPSITFVSGYLSIDYIYFIKLFSKYIFY